MIVSDVIIVKGKLPRKTLWLEHLGVSEERVQEELVEIRNSHMDF